MRVVLLHDWITSFRGGERILEAFCEIFPDAPIYTLVHVPGSVPQSIESHKITPSFLNKIPGIGEHYRKFLPLFPWAAESLKVIEKADLILSDSHCVIKAVKKPIGAKHLCYVHSPMRYIYDQYDVYFGKDAPLSQRIAAKMVRGYLTDFDQRTNSNVDRWLANSNFVKQRIQKYYKIDSEVVHPFVDLEDFLHIRNQGSVKENYFVMVTAFAPNKRVDIAIKVFNELKIPLKIIGSGQQEKSLRQMAEKNILFLGNASREEVISTLAKAQALIFPGVEDFGIVPLEALAAGTPVIAYHAGGVLETMTDKTAIFFNEANESSLKGAIRQFQNKKFETKDLFEQADSFSKSQFVNKIKYQIEQTFSN